MSEKHEQKLIVFQLKEKEYVIPVEQVTSIEKVLPITRVPLADNFIKGVINLRGVVIPAVDLKVRLGMKEEAYTERTRVIIVSTDEYEVGLIVDVANDVIDIDSEMIESPKTFATDSEAEFIEGVLQYNKRIMILLNVGKVLGA
ncbi:purine-binding chemotaxis protein CheW [Bacillus oleivorans]|uniref:Purine-binding chemotaxis protein CheW n=1 Tax=Bacillus oleivorans TaxID=1448271 RepID=A0A285D1J7_9BACI|nr:chemotaxis protein CheW [Bacillus oleivorans]SNX73707.1 purine-binding chemotaxis protein CheW [Bacillus oleivorans]